MYVLDATLHNHEYETPGSSREMARNFPLRDDNAADTACSRSSPTLDHNPQDIADHKRHLLRMASGNLLLVAQNIEPAEQILARNLRARMDAENSPAPNAERVAAKTGLAPNTVRNMLKPQRGISASLENIAEVAHVFGCSAWELLHPAIEELNIAMKLVQTARESHQSPPNHMHEASKPYHAKRRSS